MALITREQICAIAPAVKPESLSNYIPFLEDTLRRWNIITPQSIGAFISNLSVESAHFKRTLEIGSGSAYEGRTDLGNTQPGDGERFKGRGLIQLTGRTVYKQCSRDLYNNDSLLTASSILEAPRPALESACWFWSRYKDVNSVCAEPETWHKPGVHNYSKFQWICILVNGGFNDYAEREANYLRARKILNF